MVLGEAPVAPPILRNAFEHEGYIGQGRTIPGPCELVYGACDIDSRTLSVVRRVAETAHLSDTVSIPLELDLLRLTDHQHVGIGILGASRMSHLTTALRVFAYLPPSRSGRGGFLVVGNASDIPCAYPPHWMPVMPHVSPNHWVVRGSVTVGSGESEGLNWIVDTGSVGVVMPRARLEEFIATLTAIGSPVDRESIMYLKIYNCSGHKLRFPSIKIDVGDGDAKISISIHSQDYLFGVGFWRPYCYARINAVEVEGAPGTHILGITVLQKVASVFDSINDRVGMCHIR